MLDMEEEEGWGSPAGCFPAVGVAGALDMLPLFEALTAQLFVGLFAAEEGSK